MEEKIIIKSSGNYKNYVKIAICISVIIAIISWGSFLTKNAKVENARDKNLEHLIIYEDEWGFESDVELGEEMDAYRDLQDELIEPWKEGGKQTAMRTSTILTIVAIVIIIIYYLIYEVEITVTDKRVYGKAMFGKRVDLPLDSISAIATGIFNSIAVATSSGNIHFVGIENNEQIHYELSELLIERQKKIQETVTIEKPQSSADELKKFKELLDSGIITQEEFDAKKKQLLGL